MCLTVDTECGLIGPLLGPVQTFAIAKNCDKLKNPDERWVAIWYDRGLTGCIRGIHSNPSTIG